MDFFVHSSRWNGAAATIVPDNGRHVWGALWEISLKNLASLDHQEGVHINMYRPLEVTVETPEGETKTARVYMLCNNPGPLAEDQEFTEEPSKTYLNVITYGAIESEMPEEYINWLRGAKHNGRDGSQPMVDALNRYLESLEAAKKKDKTTPSQSPVLS